MNRSMLILLLLVLNLMAWTVVREINHSLAPFRIFLHLEILLVLVPALYLKALPGFVLAIGTGMLVGASRPFPIETSVLMIMGLWAAGIWMRGRIRRENFRHVAGFAAGSQLCLLLVLSILLHPDAGEFLGSYLERLMVDGLCSMAMLALVAPFWTRFQIRLLGNFGWNLDTETTRN